MRHGPARQRFLDVTILPQVACSCQQKSVLGEGEQKTRERAGHIPGCSSGQLVVWRGGGDVRSTPRWSVPGTSHGCVFHGPARGTGPVRTRCATPGAVAPAPDVAILRGGYASSSISSSSCGLRCSGMMAECTTRGLRKDQRMPMAKCSSRSRMASQQL